MNESLLNFRFIIFFQFKKLADASDANLGNETIVFFAHQL